MLINQYNKDGLEDGPWEEYHPNCQLNYKGYYKNGQQDGYWEWYYSDGQLAYKGCYKNGKEIGYWIEWGKNIFYVN